jgi:hypothetical protein
LALTVTTPHGEISYDDLMRHVTLLKTVALALETDQKTAATMRFFIIAIAVNGYVSQLGGFPANNPVFVREQFERLHRMGVLLVEAAAKLDPQGSQFAKMTDLSARIYAYFHAYLETHP